MGGTSGDFAEQFREWARVRPKLGGEGVDALRLQGTQPVMVTVRYSSRTAQIGARWRMRDVLTDEVYNITAAEPDESRRFVEILATSGEVP